MEEVNLEYEMLEWVSVKDLMEKEGAVDLEKKMNK
jgi:hypothetical protein